MGSWIASKAQDPALAGASRERISGAVRVEGDERAVWALLIMSLSRFINADLMVWTMLESDGDSLRARATHAIRECFKTFEVAHPLEKKR